MRRLLAGALAAGAAVCAGIALGAPASAPAQAGSGVEAGVAVVDSSWRVGASAGQYAGSPEGDGLEFVDHEQETFDPTGLSTRRTSSYGIQSRLSVRALVVDGPATGTGDRFAILKTDFYIPQDLVYRRAAQIVEQECSCGIAAENMTMAATHDHSSPMYSSSPGASGPSRTPSTCASTSTWPARWPTRSSSAAGDLRPVRVGAASSYYDKSHRHSFGPAIADDGTPAGYPQSDQDHDLTVIRFDDISNPSDPQPLANLVNFSQPPRVPRGQRPDLAPTTSRRCERMMDERPGRRPSTPRARSAPPSRSAPPTTRSTSGSSSPTATTRRPSARRRLMTNSADGHLAGHRRRRSGVPGQVRPLRRRLRGRDAGPLVPGPVLPSVPGRLQLQERQGPCEATRSYR